MIIKILLKRFSFLITILLFSLNSLLTDVDAGTVSFSNFGSTWEVQSDGVPVEGGFVAVGTSSTLEEFGFSLDNYSLISAIETDFKQFGESTNFGGQPAFNLDGFFSGVASDDGGEDGFSGKNILIVGGDGSGIADSNYLFLVNTGLLFEGDAPLFAASVDLSSGSLLLGANEGKALANGAAGALQMQRIYNPLVFEFSENTAVVIDCNVSFSGDLEIPSKFQGKTITSIGDNAFRDCVNISKIKIPDTITNIGVNAFSNCSSLTEINVSNSNQEYSSLDGVLFNKLKTDLIKCPARFLGDYKVPDTIQVISSRAFYGCYDLESITLSSSLVTIGESAFRACKGIKDIIIPDTVESIGEYAFLNCISLASLSVASSNRYFSSENGVLFNKEKSVLIVCGGGKVGNYVIPTSVITIGDGAFGFCESLTSIKLPDQLTTIGNYSIGTCLSLKNIIIPPSVTTIGDYAFRGCKNMNRILFQGNAPSLGIGPFSFMSSETRIEHNATASGFSYPYGGISTYPILPIKEDFDGDIIDNNLWITKTVSFNENSNVSQLNQSLNLQGGGQLVTRSEYDPSANGVAINGLWTFSSLGTDADSSNVIKGNVSVFNGPDDLMLDSKSNVIAVNVNGSDGSLNVNGVTFLSSGGVDFPNGGAPPESVENSGVIVSTLSSHGLSPWRGSLPKFIGSHQISADNLEKIMQGFRYSRSSAGYDLETVIEGLEKDKIYNVQLLFHEIKASHWNGKESYRRRFDIAVQGELVVDNLDTLGGQPWSESNGVVYSGQFAPDSEGQINILLGRQPLPGDPNNSQFLSWPPDWNPILQAVIIHEVELNNENDDENNNISFEDKGDYFQVFTQSDALSDQETGKIKNGIEFYIHSMTGDLKIRSRGGVIVQQIGAGTLGRIDDGEQFEFQVTDDGENLSFLAIEKNAAPGSPTRRAFVKARVISDSVNKNHIVFKNRSSIDGMAKINDLTINDFRDSDGDGLADWWELNYGLDTKVNDSLDDKDNDGLTNIDEFIYLSNPNNSDTDGDSLSDGYERGYGRYKVVSGKYNWEEAVINSSEMGGSLATFDTEGHWRIALSSLGNRGLDDYVGVWIGAQKNNISQRWEWFNGNEFNFNQWGLGQPLPLGGSGKAAVSGGLGSAPYLWEEVPTRGIRDGYLMLVGDLTDPSMSDTDADGWNDGTEIEFGSVPIVLNSQPVNKSRGELIYDDNLNPIFFEFRFSASYGSRYSIEFSNDLVEWNKVDIDVNEKSGQGIIGDGGTISRSYPFNGKVKFYKVINQ